MRTAVLSLFAVLHLLSLLVLVPLGLPFAIVGGFLALMAVLVAVFSYRGTTGWRPMLLSALLALVYLNAAVTVPMDQLTFAQVLITMVAYAGAFWSFRRA